MREPRPDWSPLGVNFKILEEHPYLFYISSPPPPPGHSFSISDIFISTNVPVGALSLCYKTLGVGRILAKNMLRDQMFFMTSVII